MTERGRDVRGRFTKGVLRGNAARRYCAVGQVRLRVVDRKTGRKERWIKVADTGPRGRRWVRYARYLALQARGGELPRCRVVIHADGNSLGDRVDNLLLATRRANLRRVLSAPAVLRRQKAAAAAACRRRHDLRRRAIELKQEGKAYAPDVA